MRGQVLSILVAAVCWGSPHAAKAGGDARMGREISEKHCSRCHVVGDYNRYGGIGSTPSFQLLARRDDYLERFRTFYARRPHPVFTRVPGVPAWTDLPSPVTPFEITLEQVEDIIAFIEALRLKEKAGDSQGQVTP